MSEARTWIYKKGEEPRVVPLLEYGQYVNCGWQNRPIKEKKNEPVPHLIKETIKASKPATESIKEKVKRKRRSKSVEADNGNSTDVH